jgi:hypothetical protein
LPITPVVDELQRRGHRISIRTLCSQVAALRSRGFDAEPIDPAIEAIEHDDYQARSPLGVNGAPCAPLESAHRSRPPT